MHERYVDAGSVAQVIPFMEELWSFVHILLKLSKSFSPSIYQLKIL